MRKISYAALLAASTALVAGDASAAFINGGIGFNGFVNLPTSVPAPGPTAVVRLLTTLDLDSPSVAGGGTGDFTGVAGLATTGDVNVGAPGGILFSIGGFTFTLNSVSNIVRAPSLTFGASDPQNNRTAQDSMSFDIGGVVDDGAGPFAATGFTGNISVSGSCRDLGSNGSCDDFQVATWAATLTATGSDPVIPPPPPGVPVPATLALFGAALVGLGVARRRA